jgi:hypothetical protein
MTKQHALMCHKEEGEYCVPKIRSVLKLGLEDVNWAAATEANKTVDVLCHRCTQMLPLIVASMEGLRMVSHAETEVLQRAFKLHNLVCNTDDHDQHCFPRIAAKAGLGSLPPPVYLCSGGQPCSDATMQFLRLPANAPVTSGEETVTVPPLFPVQNVVAACEPTPWLTPEKIAAMFKFVDRNGFVVTGTARVCAESCENFFAENNVSLGDGDVIGVQFRFFQPKYVPEFMLTVDNMTCSVFAVYPQRPILLTAFDELRAGIPAKLDLVMLDNGALVSQTEWADSQLVASDVRVAKQLLAHLTSKESTLSQECTDSCVQRMVLDLADMFKDTQDEKAVAISKRLETAAPVICVHANEEYCATMSKQQAVQQCVNSTGCAGCSALPQTGCCAAASVAAAGIFQPTFKNVADVQHCTPEMTQCEPEVIEEKLEYNMNYSYDWFLKNEAECTHALKKDLEVHHAPSKVLVVMVMKRDEDNTIIVVVTVEGVKAAEPGFKGRGDGYNRGYGPRGGKCTKLQEKYARDHPDEQISHNDRWAVAHCRKGGSTGTRIVWTICVCILALLGLFVVCCVYQQRRSQVSKKAQASIVIAQPERVDPMGELLLEPEMKPCKTLEEPQVPQEVYVGVVEGAVATGVPLAPMAPLPAAAEAQEPEIGVPLPPVNAAAQNPLEYAHARPQEGQ